MSIRYRTSMMILSVCLAGAGAMGCDGGGGGGGGGTEAAAKRSVDSAKNIKTAESDPSGDTALAGINALQGDLQVIVQQKQLEDLQTRTGPLTMARLALASECVSQSGQTTTYTDCVVKPATMNGTVTVSGDAVTFNMRGDIDPDAYNGPLGAAAQSGAGISISVDGVSFTESGNLTVSGSAIDGTVDATVTLRLTTNFPGLGPQTSNQDTTIHAVFDVDLDAAGCPVGGTLTVTSAQTTATVDYGPACGAVTAR